MIEELLDKLGRKEKNVRFPHALTRKGLYILPTRQGVLFILILMVMLIGSINYTNNLGFLFTFLLSSMAFISLIHTHKNLVGLTVHSAVIQPVFACEEAVLSLVIRCEGYQRTGITVAVGSSEIQSGFLPDRHHTVSLPLRTEKRGFYKIRTLTFSSSYPFGLFRTWTRVYPDLGYLVYPEALGGDFDPLVADDSSDSEGGREMDGTDDFKDLRPYRPGDPMSRLSWKSFARGKGLHVKDFSTLSGSSVLISWDAVAFKDPEKKISRLCDMVLKAHSMNIPYGLAIPGVFIPEGAPGDPGHRHVCLKALALFGTDGEGSQT